MEILFFELCFPIGIVSSHLPSSSGILFLSHFHHFIIFLVAITKKIYINICISFHIYSHSCTRADHHSSLFWVFHQVSSAVFFVVRLCLPILTFCERCCFKTWADFGFFVNLSLVTRTLPKYFEFFYCSGYLGILASFQPHQLSTILKLWAALGVFDFFLNFWLVPFLSCHSRWERCSILSD